MATNVWRGGATAVAQVATYTNSNVGGGGETWTWTVTGDDGATATATFVDDGSPTTAELYTGIVDAWNNKNHPLFNYITAAGSTPVITLTVDSAYAGRGFSVTLTASGTGAYSAAATTANVGPYDYNTTSNWTLNAVPTTGDHVHKPAGTPAIKHGLNQSTVEIGNFTLEDGDTGQIGRYEDGVLYHLRLKPDGLVIKGAAALVAIDIGAETIPITIDHTGTAVAGAGYLAPVNIKGSGITTVNQLRGVTSLAGYAGLTATVSSTINTKAGTFYIGGPASGTVTLTGATLVNNGATVYCYGSMPTVKNYSGSFRQMSGNWTTAHFYGGSGYPNADGTYATTNVYDGASLLNTEDLRAKTFTNATVYGGAIISDPLGKITWTNDIEFPEGISKTQLDFGPAVEFIPNPI